MKNNFFLLAILPLIVLGLFLLGLSYGTTGIIGLRGILDWVKGSDNGVLSYRFIRTLAALVVGAALGSAGLTYQFSLRNPLADPYLLGVSTGSAFGVVLALITSGPSPGTVYLYGLIWGIVAFLIVAGIGAYVKSGPTSLIVAGVSISYSFFGLIIIMINMFPEAQMISFTWLFGTVAYALKTYLAVTATLTIVSISYMFLYRRSIYALILGDSTAKSMGVDVEKVRLYTIIFASLSAVGAVALAGPIGFIGLAAPWTARLIFGSRFSTVLYASIMLGMASTVASDLIVRALSFNGEIPLTAVTALFGGPLLFYLSRRTGW
ncbi:MAG: iron ABC transporter permease [Desulfurococcales archaeon]|nr:iron ABC transporter permease [Desulfurococcales archaeon]